MALCRSCRTGRKRAARPAASIEEFGKRLRAGRPTGDPSSLTARLPIDDVEIKTADDGAKRYVFTISTGTIDRDRDVIDVAGWYTDAFMRSGGPVLFGHGFDINGTMPVGKATKIWATQRGLKAEMVFIPNDPFAERVQRAVDFGALRATSVGFRPLPGKAAWNEERGGIDFHEQELLEFSIVPVPANAEAVREKSATVRTPRAAEYVAYVDTVDRALKLAYALGKRGRVLSTANEDRIRAAYGHGEELCTALGEVLAQVEAMVEEEPEKTCVPPVAAAVDPVLVRVVPPATRSFAVTPHDIKGATVAALTELVAEAVRRHTGRLD